MAKDDPFDFNAATRGEELDLAVFAPKPKLIDKGAAAGASEVAQGAGFSRRTRATRSASPAAAPPPSAPPAKARSKRVNVREIAGVTERYVDVDKAQLNMLVPVPVFMRWRELCRAAGTPAWEVLERAIEALEVNDSKPAGGRS